jgi:alpha-methylacyl-CoA racemase
MTMEERRRAALHGVSVVSIAVNLPGPLAADRLTRWGAQVVKVEPPGGDPLAGIAPEWYAHLARGQQVHRIDLKDEAGLAQLHALMDEADILLTSSRPSALSRLGLDWASIRGRWPGLTQVAIVGHPDGEAPGHDLTYQAEVGLLRDRTMPVTPMGDFLAAERAATAALAAFIGRSRTGLGSYHEVAIVDACAALAEPLRRGLTQPTGPLGGGSAAYGIYATRDGFLAVAALEPHFFARLCSTLGVDGSRAALELVFAASTSAQWAAFAAKHDLPLSEIADIASEETTDEP